MSVCDEIAILTGNINEHCARSLASAKAMGLLRADGGAVAARPPQEPICDDGRRVLATSRVTREWADAQARSYVSDCIRMPPRRSSSTMTPIATTLSAISSVAMAVMVGFTCSTSSLNMRFGTVS